MPPSSARARRPTRWWAALLPALALLIAGCGGAPAPGATTAPAPTAHTVVSLTFDDGNRTQYLVRPILLDRGLRATFYINSGLVDRADGSTMTWDQIRALAADGDDIGGHTATHAVLPDLSVGQRQQEICGDRERLIAEGLHPVSFAYPTGALDPVSEGYVRSCGYLSGRSAGDVSEFGPVYAETIPPLNPYVTRALATPPTGPLTADYLRTAVTAAAAHRGGWLQIVFHQVCQASSPDYQQCMASEAPVDIGVFTDFVDWLGHGAPPGTVVETVAAVMVPTPAGAGP